MMTKPREGKSGQAFDFPLHGILLIRKHIRSRNESGGVMLRKPHPCLRRSRGRQACRYRQTHTNTIEGFWALVERAWIGQHHHYSVKYMPLYLAEACFKYNHRGRKDGFENSIAICVCA